MDKLIIVKQLPVIEAQLKSIEAQVDEKLVQARALLVTAESKQVAKKMRADLAREREDLEILRKGVKKAVLEPYEAFEKMYKDVIKNKYDSADVELKGKIDEIESAEIAQKAEEVIEYFKEYCKRIKIEYFYCAPISFAYRIF